MFKAETRWFFVIPYLLILTTVVLSLRLTKILEYVPSGKYKVIGH